MHHVIKADDLVTIVVPTYNAEDFLKENIESILNQTYRNIEVIYVCDGCTDNTENILKLYKNDMRLKVIVQKENCGAAVSRNMGMNMAKGDWIIFLDADDLFEPTMLEEMVYTAHSSGADICCCYFEYFDYIPRKDVYIQNDLKKRYCDTYPTIITENESKHIMQLVDTPPYTKLIHKNIYQKKDIYFQNIPNANDIYYSTVATLNSKKIIYIDKVLGHQRSNKERKTLSTDRDFNKSYVYEAYNKVYEYIAERNNGDLMVTFYNQVLFVVFMYIGRPVCSQMVDELRNKYLKKWKMDYEHSIVDKLCYVNRCVYEGICHDDLIFDTEQIIMRARLGMVNYLSKQGCSIWGVGEKGRRLLEASVQSGISIRHLYDSDKNKIGKKLYSYSIEKYGHGDEQNIIITAPDYFEEIKALINENTTNAYNLEKEIWDIP